MSSDAAQAVVLRESLRKAAKCTKCKWGSQPNASKGCRHCLGPRYYTCRPTSCNLQLLETLLDEGKSVDCFGLCFADRLSATVTTSLGPLCVRSPGRVPILPMNDPEPEPNPARSVWAGPSKGFGGSANMKAQARELNQQDEGVQEAFQASC